MQYNKAGALNIRLAVKAFRNSKSCKGVYYVAHMEQVQNTATPKESCAAAMLHAEVQAVALGGADTEYEMRTDELQPEGLDLGEGSAINDARELTFTEKSLGCVICKGTARLLSNGDVKAKNCPSSGRCELESVRINPEEYQDETGAPLTENFVPCTEGEQDCKAWVELIRINGGIFPKLHGNCKVEDGVGWMDRIPASLKKSAKDRTDQEAAQAAADKKGEIFVDSTDFVVVEEGLEDKIITL